MALLSHALPRTWRVTLAIGLISGLVACGGSPGISSLGSIKLEDAAIYGAVVTDSDNRTATQTGAGIYQILVNGQPVLPRLPLTITSQNYISNTGVVNITNIGGVWYSWQGGTSTSPTDKRPLTFQDLDGDGAFTQGVDIVFNGAFTVRYAPSGQSLINANPVAALIPSNWNGVDAIAGIPKEALNAATATGVQASNNADLKRAAALITAITDTLAMNGTTKQTIASVVTAIATGSGVNLLATASDANALQNAATALSTTVLSATGNSLASGNLAANIQTIAGSVGTSGQLRNGNYEAIAQIAHDNLDVLKTANPASLNTLIADATTVDARIEQGQTNAQTGNSLSSQVASLRVVPFCDIVAGTPAACNAQTSSAWLAFNRLTGFSLTRSSDGSISLSSAAGTSGNLFNSFFASNSFSVPYDSVSSKWIFKAANSSMLQISIGTGFVDPLQNKFVPGNLMQVCNADGNCVPYYLSTSSGVCNLVKTNNVVDTVLLGKINALQASDRQVTCP